MNATLQAMLEGAIDEANKDKAALIAVYFNEGDADTPMCVMRNFGGDSKVVADILELFAKRLKRGINVHAMECKKEPS